MSELQWNWVYRPYLDAPEKQKESARSAGYAKVVFKSEADKVIEEKDDEIRNLKRWLCVARHEVAKARGKNSSNKYRAKFKR